VNQANLDRWTREKALTNWYHLLGTPAFPTVPVDSASSDSFNADIFKPIQSENAGGTTPEVFGYAMRALKRNIYLLLTAYELSDFREKPKSTLMCSFNVTLS